MCAPAKVSSKTPPCSLFTIVFVLMTATCHYCSALSTVMYIILRLNLCMKKNKAPVNKYVRAPETCSERYFAPIIIQKWRSVIKSRRSYSYMLSYSEKRIGTHHKRKLQQIPFYLVIMNCGPIHTLSLHHIDK